MLSFKIFMTVAAIYGAAAQVTTPPISDLCAKILEGLEDHPKYDMMKTAVDQYFMQTIDDNRNTGGRPIDGFSSTARQYVIDPAGKMIELPDPNQKVPSDRRKRSKDLRIPLQVLKELARARPGFANIPFDIRALGRAASRLDEADAGVAGRRILKTIQAAGLAVRAGSLNAAMALLVDSKLLVGTNFELHSYREPLFTGGAPLESERAFSDYVVGGLRHPPSVNGLGTVVLPAAPIDAPASRAGHFARRLWIRIAGEELAHVAQILLDREDPSARISALLGPESSVTRSLVAMESERLNEMAPTWYGVKLLGFHNKEADVYAFLIEAFGHDFMPAWCGIDSGYAVRRLIDEELDRRGVPDRAWPAENEPTSATPKVRTSYNPPIRPNAPKMPPAAFLNRPSPPTALGSRLH